MRHIPSSDTFHADVLTFEEALVPTADDFDRSRWIYVPDHYSEYRYILGTRGKNPLVCIGINPSTAAPDRLDNTLKSAQRIALFNGYDSFIMFNVYAQRATLPDDMEKVLTPHLVDGTIDQETADWIHDKFCQMAQNPLISAAFNSSELTTFDTGIKLTSIKSVHPVPLKCVWVKP